MSKSDLEEAAEVAESIGKSELAQRITDVSDKLPEVHTPEAAAELVDEMAPIKHQAYHLGRACGLARRIQRV